MFDCLHMSNCVKFDSDCKWVVNYVIKQHLIKIMKQWAETVANVFA